MCEIDKRKLGKLLNVTIGMPGGDRDTVEVQQRAREGVQKLYKLLGEPESMVSLSNKNLGKDANGQGTYTGDAVFRFADGVIAHIMIGGPYHENQVQIYGMQGMAVIKDGEAYYNIGGNEQEKEIISVQKKQTGALQYSSAEERCMAEMLRCVLDL